MQFQSISVQDPDNLSCCRLCVESRTLLSVAQTQMSLSLKSKLAVLFAGLCKLRLEQPLGPGKFWPQRPIQPRTRTEPPAPDKYRSGRRSRFGFADDIVAGAAAPAMDAFVAGATAPEQL